MKYQTTMRGLTKLEIAVILSVAVILALILYPVFQRHGSSWIDDESYGLISGIGDAVGAYTNDHHGELPPSLGLLYPKYSRDKRVQSSIIEIGPTRRMAIIYWRPKHLGDPNTPVAEIRPIPDREGKRLRKDWILWGDLHVESVKR